MKKNLIKDNLIILSITSFIFLWDLKQNLGFDFRIFLVFLLPFIINKIYEEIKSKKFLFLILLFTLILILFIQSYINNEIKTIGIKLFIDIIAIGFLFSVAYYFNDFIIKNKVLIIYFFYFFFFSFLIFSYFNNNYYYNEPFICGGFKNYFITESVKPFFYTKNILFYENSHLAMISTPVILTSLFLIFKYKTSNIFKILFLFFIFVCISKSSATFILGMMLLCIFFLILKIESKNIKFKYTLIITIILFGFILLNDKTCKSKFIPNYNNEIFIKNKSVNEFMVKALNEEQGSLSSAIFYRALNITLSSLVEKPFGWGFQQYETAFNYFNKKNPPKNKFLINYNGKDGTNNFFKTLVEFGFIGLFIYFFLIYCFFCKKISYENKLFLFPFIICQSIRGAGYFNGGFILILFIILTLYFKKK